MNITLIKDFTTAQVQDSALTRHGKRDTLNFVIALNHEIWDIVQNGDSQVEKMDLNVQDVATGFQAVTFFQNVTAGKPAEDHGVMSAFLAVTQKAQTNYYQPKIALSENLIDIITAQAETTHERYNFLMRAAPNDPVALKKLHDEFYLGGVWDPESEEPIEPPSDPNLLSLAHERQQRTYLGDFAATLKSDFVQNPAFSARAMMGTPESLRALWSKIGCLRDMLARNRLVSQALDDVTQRLGAIIYQPQARIYKFPG
jgi:hypothetical protein